MIIILNHLVKKANPLTALVEIEIPVTETESLKNEASEESNYLYCLFQKGASYLYNSNSNEEKDAAELDSLTSNDSSIGRSPNDTINEILL